MSFRVEFPSIQGQPKTIGPVEQAMLAMSYGVHVIGSRDESGSLNLMLADWVMQTSFAPRLVALSLENDARTLRYIQAAGVFTVNMLHEKDGMDIARQVVMPAEGSKIRGRSDETASVVREKLRAITHVLVENGCPVLTQALGGTRARLRSSLRLATTRWSSRGSTRAVSFGQGRCSSSATSAGNTPDSSSLITAVSAADSG